VDGSFAFKYREHNCVDDLIDVILALVGYALLAVCLLANPDFSF
jgi:hypothetical protein